MTFLEDMVSYLEEIQVFEQGSNHVQMVFIGRLAKVNEKTIHIEHDLNATLEGFPKAGCGKVLLVHPKLESWGVRVRLVAGRNGQRGSWTQRYPGWDRRVGEYRSRPERPRLVEAHRTSGVEGPYNAGNGQAGRAGYGKGR